MMTHDEYYERASQFMERNGKIAASGLNWFINYMKEWDSVCETLKKYDMSKVKIVRL